MSKRLSYEEITKTILEIFDGNKDKMLNWWITPNSNFGNLSPFQMAKDGRGDEVMRFVRTRLFDHYY
jgi:hypothetical protein